VGFLRSNPAPRERVRLSENVTVAQTAVQDLYDRNAGRLFAYCYARIGTRELAEWAVGATLDRARAALANGGLPEHELDWLLRTADKFCGPRLRTGDGGLAESRALVLDDWEGLTFDQIASRIEASNEALERARGQLSPWRRVLGVLNVGSLVSWAKAALTGASAVKTAAAVVAITGAAVVVGSPVGDRLHDAVRPSSKAKLPAPASTGSQASRPGQVGVPVEMSGREVRAGRPVVAGATAKPTTPQAPRSVSTGNVQSPSASPSAQAGPGAAAPAAKPQLGTSGSTAPPASGEPAGPTTDAATSTSAPHMPTTTLPVDTPPAELPLPQPPPSPNTPSVPDPGAEIPPAPPVAPPADVPALPATPAVPGTPKLPDPSKLP
jgi:hypothetical protein